MINKAWTLLFATITTATLAAPLNFSTNPSAAKWIATGMTAPESVYFDQESNQIFVSNIGGAGTDKDGNGWVGTISFTENGVPEVQRFVEGLNAPKGLVARNGILWVTDIDELVKIDIKSATILEKIQVPGAVFLNDPAVDNSGRVFLADTIASKIYVVENSQASVFLEGDSLESPNGLLVQGHQLYVAAWGLINDPATFGAPVAGNLYAIDLRTKKKHLVTKAPLGHLDGIMQERNGSFLVSDWVAGKIYRVTKRGTVTLLVEGLANSADIGLQGHTLLIPSMSQDRIIAIDL